MMFQSVPLLITFGSLTLASLVLILFARRGRRINDHPICRRCYYDLIGKPADSFVCSECGADLTRRRALRIGAREKRRRLLSVATLLLLTFAGSGTFCGWNIARPTDWNRYLPAWWLVRQAHSANAPARDAALAELARRITEHRLALAQEKALVAEALDRQGDPNQPWIAGWGVLVESAQNAQRLPEDQWVRYLMQAMQFTIAPSRPAFRKCDPLEFVISEDVSRVGTLFVPPDWYEVCVCAGGNPHINLSGRQVIVSVEQENEMDFWRVSNETGEPGMGIWSEFQTSANPGSGHLRPLAFVDKSWPALVSKPGPQTARLTLYIRANWQYYAEYLKRTRTLAPPAPATPACRVVQVSCPWVLADAPRLLTDPATQARVEQAISTSSIECESQPYDHDVVGWDLTGRLTIRNPPCDLALRITMCKPGTDVEYLCTDKVFVRKGVDTNVRIETDLRVTETDYDQSSVNIKVTARPTVSPIGTKELWGGKIELHDVPVRRKAVGKGAVPCRRE